MIDFTFASFVPDAQSHRAFAAAIAVADSPGRAHNPLFLHGPAGAGKSHLLHAIERAMRDVQVVRLSMEDILTRMFAAVRSDSMDAFRETFDAADAMLIDDLGFVYDKERTQEELLHRLQALVDRGAQVVVTSHLPVDAYVLRLRRFFESGVVAELAYPGLKARIEIARRAAVARGITLSDKSLRRVAEAATPRELQSAVARIAAETMLL